MNLIDRIGVFRGKPLSWAVSTTKKGFPQFTVELLALEMYDEQSNEWTDWAGYDQRITAYLVLFNDEKALLNYKQVQDAFGWDGSDFASLQNGDFTHTVVQFRIEESEWEGKIQLKVTWIDRHDADPVRGLRPLSEADLNQLTQRFSGMMTAKPKPKPATAKKPAASTLPVEETVETPAPKKGKTPTVRAMTKEEAWKALLTQTPKDIPNRDDQLAAAWIDACDNIGQEREEDDFTPEDWYRVYDEAHSALTIPF